MGSSPFGPEARRPLKGPLCRLDWCRSHGSSLLLIKFQMAPRCRLLTSSGSTKKEPRLSTSACRQIFTFKQTMSWGFVLCSTLLTQRTVNQPHYVEMSSQGVMSGEKASNNTGLYPIKGQDLRQNRENDMATNFFIRNWWPTRCNFSFIYLYPISSTCFGRCSRPSSGALDCIYSFWYSPLMLLPAGVTDECSISSITPAGSNIGELYQKL